MPRCLIEQSLTTSLLSHPFTKGWIDLPEGMELQPHLSSDDVQGTAAVAFLGSIDAVALAATGDYRIIHNVALVSQHSGAVALESESRPDTVEHATVGLSEVSRTSEAIARATIHHFFGINVVDWSRAADTGDVFVCEDSAALVSDEDAEDENDEGTYREDLVRSWFILSGYPIPTHLLVAEASLIDEDPESLNQIVAGLQSAIKVGKDRRREIRRDYARDLNVDRDRLNQLHQDQTFHLSSEARDGLLDLVGRISTSMGVGRIDSSVIVNLGPEIGRD